MPENCMNNSRRANHTTARSGSINLINLLVILAISSILLALLLPSTRRARPAARRAQCMSNLRQIAIALLNYHEEYQALPPAFTVDDYGNPLHSWRTLILPYLDQKSLYESIDLSKPWDDPVNARACETSVWVFQCPSRDIPKHHTNYLANAAAGGCFRLAESRPLSEITDDRAQTLMVVEVSSDRSVPWMSPYDADEQLVLSLAPESTGHQHGFHAAMCDGTMRYLSASLPAAQRRALISAAAGDKVGDL